MRLPPHYGSVSKLSGKRRNPYVVRITVGYNEKGVQQYKTLGYVKNRKEGLEMLAEYHKDPYATQKDTTFEELYEMFIKRKEGNVSQISMRAYRTTYNASTELHRMPMKDIKTPHMQAILDKGDRSRSSKAGFKSMYKQLFELAMQNDLVDKNYADFLEVGKKEASTKGVYSTKAIKKLWENSGNLFVDATLILLYTGMRISELLEINMENVHLDERYMIGGLKTDAGRDRTIPIHKDILPILQRLYGDGTPKSLIVKSDGSPHDYRTFSYHWGKMMSLLNLEHTLHETRHSFISAMYKTDVRPEITKKIVGHSGSNVTETVYLHVDVAQLVEAVDKLKYF